MRKEKIANRKGVACAGNWIVDHVKLVDLWPNPGNLANILSEERGTGGAAFNVLVDLARLDAKLPLDAIGLVGNDADGQWIKELIRPLSRDISRLGVHPQAPTSYTDVMTVKETGQRTFFHMRGANAHFDVEHVNPASIHAKIFHLGYLLLLTALDRNDPDFGTRAARLLAECQKQGLITSIDVVSAEGGRFAEIVLPSLKYTDYCIVNEVEAGGVTGLALRDRSNRPDWSVIESAARKLANLGVRRIVTIHLPEGGMALDVSADRLFRVPSLPLPSGFIKGSAGAGDAFCAGMLYGLHEDWPMEKTLRLGHACAAASLRHPTCTRGMASLKDTLALAESLASKSGARR